MATQSSRPSTPTEGAAGARNGDAEGARARAGVGTRAKPATINDVAAAAGVSRQTVTRAMNDMAEVSPATKQRVLDAAAALNYRPNRAAQRLVHGGDVTIGFVVGDLRNPYYPQLASELTRLAAQRDWIVVMTDLSGPEGNERVSAMAGRVDAVVGHLGEEHGASIPAGLPTVMLADGPDGDGARVAFDYDQGIRDAVTHLLATGRRRIAMIDSGVRATVRGTVLREALSEHGLGLADGVFAPATHEGGVAAATSLARTAASAKIDAVLCFNDVLAIGALKGFARAGIRVPQDVAVVGIDGLDISTLVTPELTTLAVDMREVARHALELVDAMLRGESAGLTHTVVHTLVVRESA